MTVRDLVLLAGVCSRARTSAQRSCTLAARRGNGVTAVTTRIPLDSSYLFERSSDGRYLGPPGIPAPSGPAPEVLLQPYDNVLILEQPGWQLQRTVAIEGEVRYPGRYTLTTKTERLSDLLQRAGGLTRESYAEGIRFFRTRDGIGRIGINLPRVLRNPRDRDNFLLEDGDSLVIPRYNPVVNVGGAVNSPVAVAFVPGKDLSYYIQAAGGATRAVKTKGPSWCSNGAVESVREGLFLFSRHDTQTTSR